VLALIPLFGGVFMALLAPIFLSSSFISFDFFARQQIPLPAKLRGDAIKQAPRALLSVFREERHLIPVVVVCLYAMIVALVAKTLGWGIADRAWTLPWSELEPAAFAWFVLALLVMAVFFLLASASLVYALPLAFIQHTPLFPAMGRSFRKATHYAAAMLTVFSVLLVPFLLGAIVSIASVWLGYVVGFVAAGVALAVLAASLFCSYRMIFAPDKPARR
jgi:membrane-anchored glycerophosphoryl diester phosphodiesterase (GDPDase)